jgi:cysteinyl-tRNA synthetase
MVEKRYRVGHGAPATVSRVIHLHDTASGTVRELALREPGKVGMYVCGPTVYGPPHLGHGRFSLVFDVLRRYLEWTGFEVRYISNITDIDDNIIERGKREGRPPEEIAVRCEAVWYQAMDAIGVKRPTVDPHATAYVAEMISLVEQLVERGNAYATSDGVYLSVETIEDYGLLAHQSLADMRAGGGERALVGEEKRDPADFVLWKLAKPGEPSWESPWGAGRPGWHTECVAMSLDLLGERFDLHGGGRDLAFPHHENERAQAVALGREFAAHWVHNGWVEVGGEKMSKSLDNFTNLLDLIDSVDPRAYRLLVLQSHYRSPLEISKDTTDRAERSLAGLDAFARRVAAEITGWHAADHETIERFSAAMDDDLDTPAAMALLFDSVRKVNAALDSGDVTTAAPLAGAVEAMCEAVGLELRSETAAVPAEVAALAVERDAARAAKDFARADAIRGELQADGWIVEDSANGTLVRRP